VVSGLRCDDACGEIVTMGFPYRGLVPEWTESWQGSGALSTAFQLFLFLQLGSTLPQSSSPVHSTPFRLIVTSQAVEVASPLSLSRFHRVTRSSRDCHSAHRSQTQPATNRSMPTMNASSVNHSPQTRSPGCLGTLPHVRAKSVAENGCRIDR